MGKCGLKIALEKVAGVLKVLFRVSLGSGDTFKRFVEDGDDPLLLGERGIGATFE